MVVYNNRKTVAIREKAASIIWFYALTSLPQVYYLKKLQLKT